MIDDRPDFDELDELARANPIQADELESVFAIDRQSLIDMLEADVADRRLGRITRLPATRIRYVAATAAVAAAAVIVALAIGGSGLPNDRPIDPAAGGVADPSPAQPPALRPDLDSAEPGIADDTITTTTTTATTATTNAATEPAPATQVRTDGGFNTSVDLLSLHSDHAHLDDGHAAAAALELASWFDIDPHVVAGTYPDGYDGRVNDYGPVMDAVWGDGWLDAHLDPPGALDATVTRWLITLDIGGHVWVAEGGVSDFTAAAVDRVQQERPDLDTTVVIHVVQHNDRNESETTPSSLRFVKANTDYERIDDGNSANDTADLNQSDDGFRSAALAGSHREAWAAAFDYHPPDQLDFSDTVEVLHILGIGTDEVASPADFADRFLR